MIKKGMIFAAGAGLGVLGSAFFFWRRSEKICNEYEEKCAAEYEELKAELCLKQDYVSESLEKSQGDISEKTSKPSGGRTDYTQFAKPDVKDVIKRAEDKLAAEEGPMEEDTKAPRLRGPRLIKAEDYGNDRTLEMQELFYYTDTCTLTDEEDEVISGERAELLLGDALIKFGFDTNDEDTIYVRNERHGADYMITKIRAPYTGDI